MNGGSAFGVSSDSNGYPQETNNGKIQLWPINSRNRMQ